MSKALSVDLRERVMAVIAGGASCRAAATRFGVSASSAIRWASLARERGSVTPKALGGDRRSARIEAHAPLILELVERTSDITLREIRAELARTGVSAGIGTLLRAPAPDMEKKTAHASEQDRPDVLRRREAWFEDQPDLDPARLVFVDETWASTNMARTHGRAPRGERLRVGIPHGHWKSTTFIAGLRSTGMVAPMVLDGPVNGSAFQAYVEQVLVPELRPGDVWWMAAQCFIRWTRLGVWERLLALVTEHDVQLGMAFLDGTTIRAHQKAAGASKRGAKPKAEGGSKTALLVRNEALVRRLVARVAAMAPRPA